MLQPAAREQHVAGDQRIDHRLVRVALLAVVIDHARRAAFAVRAETRRVLGEEACIVDGEGDGGVDAAGAQVLRRAHPRVEVFAAMAGCGVHEAGACIVGDVVAGKHAGRRKSISAAEAHRMDGGKVSPPSSLLLTSRRRTDCQLGFRKRLLRQGASAKMRLLARSRTKIILRDQLPS